MKAVTLALILFPSVAFAGPAPSGFYDFCRDNIQHCTPSEDARADLTPAIERINRKVNRSIRWTPDNGDVWTVGKPEGDCEDYALTKRARMIKEGVPAGSLRLALVTIPSGQAHAVLVLKTPSGDLVLDNRTDDILPANETGYSWISIQGSNPFVWGKR